jgi:ATP-dependent RNA helicase DeaD
VEHIGLVINYDIPNDSEAYVHRIGRTARAGRTGKAILLVTPREAYMMREIERYTGQKLTLIKAPTHADINAKRRMQFKNRLLKVMNEEELDAYLALIGELANESGRDLAEIAAAAAWLARGSKPLVVPAAPEPVAPSTPVVPGETAYLWFGAGLNVKMRPADLVGAIANEAGIDGKEIGPINIQEEFSLVGVPSQYVDKIIASLRDATIRRLNLKVRRATANEMRTPAPHLKARKTFARSDAGDKKPKPKFRRK